MSAPVADAGPIPIFLLKTRSSPHDGYEDFFSALTLNGHKLAPTFVPVLEHTLLEPGLDTVRQLLHSRRINDSGDEGTYGGMIFTSQRAVEAFATLVDEGPSPSTDTTPDSWPYLSSAQIYTVGPATTRALRSIPTKLPLQIDGAHTGNGEALAQHILTNYPHPHPTPQQQKPRPPLLFLVGDTRRDIIPTTLMSTTLPPTQRIRVDEIEVYGTTTQLSFPAAFAADLAASSEAKTRWVVVFSPTGCEAALRELGLLDDVTGRVKTGERGGGCGIRRGKRQTYVATIGPTTRDFLRKQFGFEADVCAEQPSPEGVGEGIRKFMVGLD